jgi:hypothetical protein
MPFSPTNYKIDRIEVMIDKSNHFISKAQMRSLIRDNPLLNSIGQFRHAIFTIGKIFSMINKIKTHIAFGGINLIV